VITEAIILAGGFGTRLQKVVSDVPKPMALVADKPFLHYLILQLQQQGIFKIIISTGYKAEVIANYFVNNKYQAEIICCKEEEPLGTGGGIKYAMQFCNSSEVLVLNGDTYFDVNFAAMQKTMHAHQAKALLALRFVENASRYGQVLVNEDNCIISFSEKNTEQQIAGLINGGTYLLNKEYFIKHTPEKFSIETNFFEPQVKQACLFGTQFDNYFIDIGIAVDYYKANEDFRTF
jgi:D-glycero-alpha-D-manno-heptose 1-phosphate guanylyltransferase